MKKQVLFLLLVPIVILAMTASTFAYCPPSGSIRYFEEPGGDEHPWGGENDGPTGEGDEVTTMASVISTPFFVLDVIIAIYQVKIVSVPKTTTTTEKPMTDSAVFEKTQPSNTPSQTGTQRGL